MESNPALKRLERLISPAAESMGYELVRILLVGAGSGKPTLQIMAERPDGTMGVDDCEKLSKAISAVLDVENAVDGAYYLELSSPGIDRPLTRRKDFDRYKGLETKIELEDAVDGQKKFKGSLKGIEGDTVTLETEKGPVALPFPSIIRAKLVLTDELVKAATRKKS
jgi:ribosome maturation factor RimP